MIENQLKREKIAWTTPELIELKPDLIRQQDDEILYHVLNSEEVFRLVSGSAPSSDYRLKEDAQDFDALSVVNTIAAYDFAWKANGQREYGFMAHEIQEVMPYLVTGQKDQVDENGQPIIQRVNYAKLTPVLLKAIQQQQKQVEELKKVVEALSGKINFSKQQIA